VNTYRGVMPSYTTALDAKPHKHPAFGSNYVSGPVVDVHAVKWPDPDGRAWDEVETVCGRPTRGMEQQPHFDPTEWPLPKWRDKACWVCAARTE
jgi:hypothetical protein